MKYAFLSVAIVLVAIVAVPLLKQKKQAFLQTPLDYPPAVLEQKDRDLAASFGYTRRPLDTEFWFNQHLSVINYMNRLPQPRDFKAWLASEAPAFAIYRQSQETLIAPPTGDVDSDNPPLTSPGSIRIYTDAAGRLRDFLAVPYSAADTVPNPVSPDAVFRAAQFDPARFSEVSPTTLPTVPTDTLRAWKGPHPVIPGLNLQIEMGWFKGRLTHMKIIWPWTATGLARTNPTIAEMQGVAIPALLGLGLLLAILLARGNWKKHRADGRGAFLVGLTMFVLSFVYWAFTVHFAASTSMLSLTMNAFSESIAEGVIFLILYLALEPALRLRWPHSIITWNRILAGRWSDPQVGSHILIGLALGAAMILFGLGRDVAYAGSEGLDTFGGLYSLMGTRYWLGGLISRGHEAITTGLIIFFVVFGLRTLLRRDWIAALAGGIFFSAVQSDLANSLDWKGELAVYLVVITALIFALLRLGLLVSVVAIFSLNTYNGITLGTDWTAWYAPAGFASVLALMAITAAAFRTTLGERELL